MLGNPQIGAERAEELGGCEVWGVEGVRIPNEDLGAGFGEGLDIQENEVVRNEEGAHGGCWGNWGDVRILGIPVCLRLGASGYQDSSGDHEETED